jgi:hypothetical protein
LIAMPFGHSVANDVAIAFHGDHGYTARHAEAVRQGVEKTPGVSELF